LFERFGVVEVVWEGCGTGVGTRDETGEGQEMKRGGDLGDLLSRGARGWRVEMDGVAYGSTLYLSLYYSVLAMSQHTLLCNELAKVR